MSDAYADYCEEQRISERMKLAMNGLKKWNTISNDAKFEKLVKLRSEFNIYESKLRRDLSNLDIGQAKEELNNLRCYVLNALESLGIV